MFWDNGKTVACFLQTRSENEFSLRVCHFSHFSFDFFDYLLRLSGILSGGTGGRPGSQPGGLPALQFSPKLDEKKRRYGFVNFHTLRVSLTPVSQTLTVLYELVYVL